MLDPNRSSSTGHPEGVSVGSDALLARSLADAAGRELLVLRRHAGGMDPDALRAMGDRRSHELLTEALRTRRPADAILSEEGADDSARLQAERVWIIDPLDGTREFGEPGRTDWAVHVALWERGCLAAGAVTMPARGVTLATDAAGAPLAGPTDGPWRIAVSRTRPPSLVARLRDRFGAQLVPMGSAGVKACAVVRGDVDAYVHAGGQYEWDSAAPVAVARAYGLHASRLDGSPLRYNAPNPRLPDLVVCRMEIAADLLEALTRAATAA